MGAGGWRWKGRGQACLMIRALLSPVWNRERGGKGYSRWGISGNAGASGEMIYRKKEGRGKGWEGERGEKEDE